MYARKGDRIVVRTREPVAALEAVFYAGQDAYVDRDAPGCPPEWDWAPAHG